jgi:fatty acid synthase subunit alpha
MSEMMITNSLVKIKEAPPYTPELEVPVLLNSMVRATLDAKTSGCSFPKKLANEVTVDKANAKTIADIIADTGSSAGIGVDQGIGKETMRCTSMSCSPSTISTSHTWLH